MTVPAKAPELPAIPRVVESYEQYLGILPDLPAFPEGQLTYEWYQRLLPMLAAPMPDDAVQRAQTRSVKGYDTTGIGYQWVVNRLNEVLPGHWNIVVEKTDERPGKAGKEKTLDWWDIDEIVTIQIGNWVDGKFVVLDQKTAPGGHGATNRADALKGAMTNALKKAAALFGVGREAYEGSLDDDNQVDERQPNRAQGDSGEARTQPSRAASTAHSAGGEIQQPGGRSSPSGSAGTRQTGPTKQGASSGTQPSGAGATRNGADGQRAAGGPQGSGQSRQTAGTRSAPQMQGSRPQPAATRHDQPAGRTTRQLLDGEYAPPPEDDQGYGAAPDAGEPGNDPPKEIDLSTWKGDCAYTAILEEDPRQGKTSRGDAYTAVKVVLFENDCEVVIRAFGDLASVLAQYGRGEAIAITGKAQVVNDKPGIKCETVGLAQDAA